MLKDVTRNGLVGLWLAAVVLVIVSVIAMGVTVTVSTSALLITLSLVPPGILLALWRGAPPPTIGEVLYVVNTDTDDRS